MAITPLPPAPEPGDTPQQFNSKAFAFVDALDTFVTEANAQATTVNTNTTTATTKAAEAAASADAASQTANVVQWVTGTTYAAGDNVFSPIDYQTYRAKSAFTSSTDPSADLANWTRLTNSGVFAAGAVGTPSITTTGDLDTGIYFPAGNTIAFTEGGVGLGNLNTYFRGLFRKADPTIVAWTKTGNFTVSTATALTIEVNGTVKTIAASTAVTMPGSASTGTDYAIWAKTDGSLEATSNHTSPPTANARKVGGFHYAPGSNASGVSGGNTTAQINEYSFWDLKFRPACPDPRGMTLVAGGFWADIYLCGVDHYTNGTSKFNVTIADGSSLPKISAAFGGNGSTTYAGGTWFSFSEIMAGVGKRLPTYLEACAYAYGTTEASSGGTDPTSTVLREAYTSKWGVMLATGNMWQWLRDFIANGKDASDGDWQTGLTETRGNIFTFGASARAGIFGGFWPDTSNSGSRCSIWAYAPSLSYLGIGARGVCDHLQLD